MRAKLLRNFSRRETRCLDDIRKGKVGELTFKEDGMYFYPLGYPALWKETDQFFVKSDEVAVQSFDGKLWTYRPMNQLFQAGEQWFTIEYYEAEYQRRLL